MKKQFYLSFFVLFILSHILTGQQKQTADITVMSYNIWFDNPNNTENLWKDRKKGVIETFFIWKPSIICVQEALSNQVKDVQMDGYSFFGVGRDDGDQKGEFAGIFYSDKLFDILDGGNFWLSEFPDSAGTLGWDAACVRIASWVKLNHRPSGKVFFVFNTHFDHVGKMARIESIKLIHSKIQKISGNLPVILCGDFNFKKQSDMYHLMLDSSYSKQLFDAGAFTDDDGVNPDFTFVGSDFTGKAGDIIDYIFISEEIMFKSFRIIENCSEQRCPSDHLPILGGFNFN